VSRAPPEKLRAYKQRMVWMFPWACSVGGNFNFDFNVSFTEQQQREGGVEYNYQLEFGATVGMEWRDKEGPVANMATMTGTDVAILMTTGYFTADAIKMAQEPSMKPIELIDGDQIVALLEKLQLGLKPTYTVDEDFFEDFENAKHQPATTKPAVHRAVAST
jgi:hypothetical protein